MNKKTLFIIIAAAIIVLSSLAIIINSQLNRMADGFGIPDLDQYNSQDGGHFAGGTGTAPGTPSTPGYEPSGFGSPTPGLFNPLSPEQEAMAAEVQARLNRPVNRKDLIKAGLILVGSLSREQLNYVYEVGRKDRPSREELIQVRDILLNNLSPEDIAALRELGGSYGKSLHILDPSVPIR